MIFNPYINRTEMTHEISQPLSVITRSSGLLTDSFLLLSGMLTSYSYIGRFKKGIKINLAKEFADRYIRIMPPIIAMMLLTAFIFPLLGSGPQWNIIVKPQSDLCHKYWWRNLLLIQNFFGFENICGFHTHHVANDTQLRLMAPFVAFLLWKLNKKGLLYVTGLIVLSHVGRLYMSYTRDITEFMYFGVK